MEEDNVWDWLKNYFSEEYISNFVQLLYNNAKSFFEYYSLINFVYLDEPLFEICIRDILVDLTRIKPFHDINNLNTAKLISYSASWWIRRKPFQIIQGNPESCNYVFTNEAFACYLLYQVLFFDNEGNIRRENFNEEWDRSDSQIKYHLKYRNIDPQALELMLAGFTIGKTSIA